MAVTFAVDDVIPATAPAATVPLHELVGDHAYLGGDRELRVLDDRTHPLIGAVHHAFVDHRPLVLSPDAIWLTIAQGVAQHVRLHAEQLRPRIVAHAGKQVLEIALATRPTSATEWVAAIAEFRRALAHQVGGGRARLLACEFSTTTDAERVASEVVMMDVMSPYYDYRVSIVCGIPAITLLGTVDDWRAIRARIDVIAELELAAWARSLAGIADQLVAAASGHADRGFFQRIYKPRRAYGWDRVTGWVARLYPYVQSERGDFGEPNPLLALALDHDEPEPETDGYYSGPGIRTSDPPPGPSRVVVRMHDTARDAADVVTIEGGLLAVEQTPASELVPRAGFVVRVGSGVAHVVERLREHEVVAGEPAHGEPWHHDAQLRALFEAVASATLVLDRGVWKLLPPAERAGVLVARDDWRAVAATIAIDAGDGTRLAVVDSGHVVRLAAARLAPLPPPAPVDADAITPLSSADTCTLTTDERAERIPIVAASLIELLARTLADGIDLRSTASLLDVTPELWDTRYHAQPLLERLRRDGNVVDASDARAPLGVLELRVGAATWRRYAAPPEWNRGKALPMVQLVDPQLWAQPLLVIDDGGVLAGFGRGMQHVIVRLELAAIAQRAVDKRRAIIVSSQPLDDIPVLGRCLVDVVTFAVDHGALPRPVETLADRARRR